jgi:SAM-dependent methyltransferase
MTTNNLKMTNKMDKNYWENRYINNETGWDIGDISTPLREYIDQIEDKTLKILIPGAGNGYEFDYLIHKGFNNVYVIDLARQPIENLKSKHPTLSNFYFICDDFFRLNQKFDLILEQTFFCAIDPKLRPRYAQKMHDLLKPNGRLVGLLFDFPLTKEGPPFGGNLTDYKGLFENFFNFQTFENSYNSIKPRAEKELFINFKRKNNP